jgi:hypothetical protein
VWKWSWSILRYYSGIFLEDLRKSTKNLSQDIVSFCHDQCLCGLVVSVKDYKHRGPVFDSWALLRIFPREFGLERGPLSLVIG